MITVHLKDDELKAKLETALQRAEELGDSLNEAESDFHFLYMESLRRHYCRGLKDAADIRLTIPRVMGEQQGMWRRGRRRNIERMLDILVTAQPDMS